MPGRLSGRLTGGGVIRPPGVPERQSLELPDWLLTSLGCLYSIFTASHRGGSGSPLVCLHGFMDTWRAWELVLPELERHHDVLALTFPGHAGGPPLEGPISDALLPDAIERAMDDAGFGTAHIVGNSLGGFVALQLAARGRSSRSSRSLRPAAGRRVMSRSRSYSASSFGCRLRPRRAPRARGRSWPQRTVGGAQRSWLSRTSSTFRLS
jgi:pimeloyl-ACP methyl ester carboxylesterase